MRLIDADELLKSLNSSQMGAYMTDDINTAVTIQKIIELILEQATITVGEWIPCREKLPQQDEPKTVHCDTVAILLKKANEVCGDSRTFGWLNRDIDEEHGGEWTYYAEMFDSYYGGLRRCSVESGEVIAWMPLPEPYKE